MELSIQSREYHVFFLLQGQDDLTFKGDVIEV